MFSVTADFNMADVEAYIQKETDKWLNNLLETFREQGREFTKRAREKTKDDGGFGNITWNLRSSIGYCLVKDSQVIESYFPPVGGGDEGSKTGDAFAREIALLIDDGPGITLVLVAGMEYASFVETNSDVIRGSSTQFEIDVKELLR